MSDDGLAGITVIAFVGSVFSPYYAWARRQGLADPENHCALNVAIYLPGGKCWSMTERGRRQINRAADRFAIGPSELTWSEDGTLTIRIDEIAVPVPRQLRGTIRVTPVVRVHTPVVLDARQRHHWLPVAPHARVEVEMDKPALKWRGEGYLDTNAGQEPLEDGFAHWTWSRTRLADRTVICYEVTERAGGARALAFEVDATGHLLPVAPPPPVALPKTGWGLPRSTRNTSHAPPRILRTLEDAPFYARSSLATNWHGAPAITMHESLSLDRFRAPWVQVLLPFRMPRRAG